MGKHAKFSPSAAHRWLNCPGSIALTADIPNTSSIYADEGTCAHEVGEKALPLGPDVDLTKWVGEKLYKDVVVTEEMIEAVQVYIDTIHGDGAKQAPGPFEIEAKLDLSWLCPDTFGRGDYIQYFPGQRRLRVYDYKHGKGYVVEVKENPQAMIYGLGGLKLFRDMGLVIDIVELIIVQPRAFHRDGMVRRWKITAANLMKWGYETLKPAVLDALGPKRTFLANGDWCRFCPAMGICPKLTEKALETAGQDFDVVVGNAPGVVTLPDIEHMTVAELARVADFATLLDPWIKGVMGHLQDKMTSGVAVPGYKLVAKRSLRKWEDLKTITAKAETLVGDAAFAPRKLKSPAQLEKLMGKTTVAPFWIKPDAGVTIAAEKDKRRAVALPAAADFLADAEFLK